MFIYENQAKTKNKAKGHIKNSVVSSMLYREKNLVAGRIYKKKKPVKMICYIQLPVKLLKG